VFSVGQELNFVQYLDEVQMVKDTSCSYNSYLSESHYKSFCLFCRMLRQLILF
jgi:hypothetical protein